MIGIIDYGMGNLGSVKKKLDRIGAESVISSKPDVLAACKKLILPGVGHFGMAVEELKERELWDFLHESVLAEKKPILGICLGMQLMAASSEEGDAEGFGWINGKVVRFDLDNTVRHKIPHMGWNSVTIEKKSELFNGLPPDAQFYFVHAYHLECRDQTDVLNKTDYGKTFVSAVQKENIIGVQYHPEKSHDAGELLLRNFVFS